MDTKTYIIIAITALDTLLFILLTIAILWGKKQYKKGRSVGEKIGSGRSLGKPLHFESGFAGQEFFLTSVFAPKNPFGGNDHYIIEVAFELGSTSRFLFQISQELHDMLLLDDQINYDYGREFTYFAGKDGQNARFERFVGMHN